jgi:AcrR family transcriptional regulator
MRVTAETRSETRARILAAAQELFASQGFEASTTRDIAREAKIATGTLFNYFPSKEAIVACLATEALETSGLEFERRTGPGEPFEEELFALVAAGLRQLRPLRTFLPAMVEATWGSLSQSSEQSRDGFQTAHLQAVVRLAYRHGYGELSTVALQIYWSLYTGLLFFWARDRSPRQEDTLALLDHSLEMFTGWLAREPDLPQPGARKPQE